MLHDKFWTCQVVTDCKVHIVHVLMYSMVYITVYLCTQDKKCFNAAQAMSVPCEHVEIKHVGEKTLLLHIF